MAKRNLTLIAATLMPLLANAQEPQERLQSSPPSLAEDETNSKSMHDNPRKQRGTDARPDGRRDREQSKRNRHLWENMSEQEREIFRRKAKELHQNAKFRVEEILQERGIELTPEQRAEFFRRYIEERREIERALRERMQQERERMEAEAIEKIQAEILWDR